MSLVNSLICGLSDLFFVDSGWRWQNRKA